MGPYLSVDPLDGLRRTRVDQSPQRAALPDVVVDDHRLVAWASGSRLMASLPMPPTRTQVICGERINDAVHVSLDVSDIVLLGEPATEVKLCSTGKSSDEERGHLPSIHVKASRRDHDPGRRRASRSS